MDKSTWAAVGKRLFFIRGTYIYTIIVIATWIAWTSRDWGPFVAPEYDVLWFWMSLSIASLGAIVRIITSGFAALGTSGRAKVAAEASELNTTGPYSLVRNPLYLGRILNFTGIAMLSGSWVFGLIVFVAACVVYSAISAYEAGFLKEKFGATFDDWASRIPALIPRLTGWTKPKYPFWWKRMIWREQNKLFLLALAVFATWFARTGFDGSQLQGPWVTAFFALVVIRFVIGGLKMGGYFKELS